MWEKIHLSNAVARVKILYCICHWVQSHKPCWVDCDLQSTQRILVFGTRSHVIGNIWKWSFLLTATCKAYWFITNTERCIRHENCSHLKVTSRIQIVKLLNMLLKELPIVIYIEPSLSQKSGTWMSKRKNDDLIQYL